MTPFLPAGPWTQGTQHAQEAAVVHNSMGLLLCFWRKYALVRNHDLHTTDPSGKEKHKILHWVIVNECNYSFAYSSFYLAFLFLPIVPKLCFFLLGT